MNLAVSLPHMQTEHIAELERKKYERAWAIPEYADYSPGVSVMPLFRQMVKPRQRGSLIDIGAGSGKASMMLSEDGWHVTMLDHVKATDCPLPFIQACVFQPWPTDQIWDIGFSSDVLEHIPPGEVDHALDQIFRHCRRAFFSINFLPDHFGRHVGHNLHLTVQPFEWWVAKLREYGPIRNARDILGEGVFYVGR